MGRGSGGGDGFGYGIAGGGGGGLAPEVEEYQAFVAQHGPTGAHMALPLATIARAHNGSGDSSGATRATYAHILCLECTAQYTLQYGTS